MADRDKDRPLPRQKLYFNEVFFLFFFTGFNLKIIMRETYKVYRLANVLTVKVSSFTFVFNPASSAL